jgi:spermidine/putrescine transport system permease protein
MAPYIIMRSRNNIFLATITYGVLLYILLPVAIMFIMSLKAGEFIGFPIRSWTLDSYAQIGQDTAIQSSFFYSIFVATASTILALISGVWIALFVERLDGSWRFITLAVISLPVVVPGIVSALSFLIYFRALGFSPGTGALIVGFAAHSVPFVTIMVLTRLRSMPGNLLEAARDLGAGPLSAFVLVALPFLRPAIFGAAIFSLMTGLDDFVRAFFLSGQQQTLPLVLYSRMNTGMSPGLVAISCVVLLFTAGIGAYGETIVRRIGVRR